ncbi:hypothetical protein [Scytonema hofmannii]|uniref:hypothetical protein n=1 Tax=Scytonema hofmannii TaxID=34078 RepID=UPI00234E51C5|nr:hypothetical protein [Scytonema hofmannii]
MKRCIQLQCLLIIKIGKEFSKYLETYQEQQKEELNLNKYVGVITLSQESLEYQQQIRNEWKCYQSSLYWILM